MKVDVTRIEAWESGSESPSLPQAKVLAKQYRIFFAYLYLPDIPQRTKRLEKVDYRTFGNQGLAEMSRELRWFLRDIEERRDVMLELYTSAEMAVRPFKIVFQINSSENLLATELRKLLSLSAVAQSKFRKPETMLSYCVSKLEERDFLIFQAAKIQPNEMRGLSVAYEEFPIIVLNRKDEPSARLFTLLHELVHIVTRTSGICNNVSQNELQQNKIELYCNKVAGLALVPTNFLLQNKNVPLIQQYGIDDAYIRAIARDFAVSREVIIHRLWDIGIIDRKAYFDTLNTYSEEYMAYRRKKKTDGFLPPALDNGTQVGKLYTKAVMGAYHAEKLTPRDASNYLLGLRIKHFGAIERWCY